ncbi:MAG: PAS domain S-box protein [Rhodospirillales bacterium]|nr:PAS domain S-box protein [Rhodospirillales bacterium]
MATLVKPVAWIERPVFAEVVGFLFGFVIAAVMVIIVHTVVREHTFIWPEVFLPAVLTGMLASFAVFLSRRSLTKNSARAHDLFVSAFRMSPALSAITDLETSEHLDVNDTWVNTLGITREDVIGKTAMELGLWVDLEARTRLMQTLRENGSVRGFEAQLTGRDGTVHDILMDCDIIHSDENRQQVMWSGRDVTQHKQNTRSLKLFHGVMAESKDAIFISNAEDGTFVEVNDQACRSLGYNREELIGMRIMDIDPQIDGPESWKKHVENLKKNGGMILRSTHRRKDGQLFPVEVGIRLVTFKDRTYNVGVARDISETLRGEADLKRAKDSAEYANHLKTQFLANMSHELRTPLNAIIGFADILKGEMFGPLGNDRYKEYANDISDSGGHLLNVITDILDVSRIETGTLDFKEEDVNLERTIISCLRLMQRRADDAEVKLLTEVPETLPLLWADQLRIKQVIINLLGNAIKFTPAGGTVIVDAGTEENGVLWLSIVDTGIGMLPEDIPKALEPFGQVGDLMTHPHEGSGLGLYIVKSLVESHEGSVEIESTPKKGTTVIVRFPKARVRRL